MSTRRQSQFPPSAAQRGMALISGLLLLVVVTLLAMSMFHSYGTQQKIAGTVREKQRALSAAISAQQYAEFWLSNNLPSAGDCTGTKVSTVPQVCKNYPDFAVVPWTLGTNEVGVTFANFTGPVSGTPTKGTYFDKPRFYVTDLGLWSAGPGEVYQIDAAAWGGSSETVAVVESTYLLSPAGRNYDK